MYSAPIALHRARAGTSTQAARKQLYSNAAWTARRSSPQALYSNSDTSNWNLDDGCASRHLHGCPSTPMRAGTATWHEPSQWQALLSHARSSTSCCAQEYTEHMGPLDQVRKGCLVSMADGDATSYALNDLQVRGTLFVRDGDAVYAGMIIGESATEDDLHVRAPSTPCQCPCVVAQRDCDVRECRARCACGAEGAAAFVLHEVLHTLGR